MNIIGEFESKLKIIGWEKVYSARELMKIFWYYKWERFLWAISRAKSEIKDEEKINKNFFYVIDKKTWWRPKEDVLLTLWACFLVLKKCDNRKENVKILISYLEEVLEEKRNKINQKKYSWEKVFLFLFSWFIIFSLWFYFKNYLSFLYIEKEKEILLTEDIEIQKQQEKQKNILEEYEEKIQEVKLLQENTFKENLDIYIKSWGEEIFEFSPDFNYRNSFTKGIVWEDIIFAFLELWNHKLFRDSCSLLSKKNCLSSSKSALKEFSNFWEKTKTWYEVLDIYKVESANDKNRYCVKYKYKLKYDTSDEYIIETFNYKTNLLNWFEEITGRFCEKIEKWKRVLKCPFQLENYYCN